MRRYKRKAKRIGVWNKGNLREQSLRRHRRHKDWRVEIDRVTRNYARRLLVAGTSMGVKDVPEVLIDAKRWEIKLGRVLREKTEHVS